MNAKLRSAYLVTFFMVAMCSAVCAQQQPHPIATAEQLNRTWSRGQATGKGPVKLQSFPLRLDDIGYIIPLGNMQSGHTTPSDHLYLVPKGAVNQFRGNMRGQGQGQGQG